MTSHWIRILVGLSAFAVALVTFRFALLGLELAFPEMRQLIAGHGVPFLMHVISAPIALALGAIPFAWPRQRLRFHAFHRWSGRLYGLAILIGGIGGLLIAPFVNGGIVAALGFGLLSVLWLATTGRAVLLAMNRRFVEHRRWMIRSYALTFAAVTLRLYLLFFMLAGWSYTEASPILAWICWVPNLIAAELLLRGENSKRLSSGTAPA